MFTQGFEKVASFIDTASRVGRSAMKYAKNPTVLRNAAIGAGAGAIGGAAGAEDGSKIKGAILGGMAGGLGAGAATAGLRAQKASARLGAIKARPQAVQ